MKKYSNKPVGPQPFKTPDGYFTELEEKILNSSVNKKSDFPFKTPEGYFEQLDRSIESRILTNNNNNKIIPLFNTKFYWTAACFLILVGLSILYLNKNEQITNSEVVNIAKQNKDSSLNSIVNSPAITKNISKEPLEHSNVTYAVQPVTSSKQVKKTQNIVQKKSELKNRYEEKTSEVIYSLYIDDTSDDTNLTSEEEFFL